ncbi:TPA: hypothetical protein QDB15_000032 [Burkholderia vietnamiensis]|uniref:hypothetical protein n=1 Tax=Burkholderia vietnamiensis TaxID=60552 RepID=UPI001CF15D24|nr:hypothetical protein [Burkholderia vietnamiensis]MCA8206306.1 hypothetical protein [Burkholderia vietnamiensis]HDR9116308.1 hypothetical protein [Burkholderia vietnamiensis]
MSTPSLLPAVVTTKPRSLEMSEDRTVIRVPVNVTLADGSQYSFWYHVHAGKEFPNFNEVFGDPKEAGCVDAYRLLDQVVMQYLHTDTEDNQLREVLRQVKAVAEQAVDTFFAEVAASLSTKH